ncbi:MAG: type II toxin-antitoxin system VapC family toxin [Chloroflexi bacterium]|nr:type II toxin-antitoxin system VapC family toxin [Chloroflexota bacterium]
MICVDASLAAKWVFEEELSEEARALYRDAITTSERIVAPPLLPIEVTNIVRQRMRRIKPPAQQPVSLTEAQEALDRFLAFAVEISLPSRLHRQALALAVAHGLAAVYDAHYVALAQMLGCEFWTADRNLVNALREKLPFVRWIGDYVRR